MSQDSLEHGYDTLSSWRAERDTFVVFFLRRSQALCNRFGYLLEPDRDALNIAHASWAAACDHWKKERVHPNSGPLSHVKVLSLLLHHLVSVDWAPVLRDASPAADPKWTGKEAIRDAVRKCINGGRGDYLAFQFAIDVINWFEKGRDDRTESFVFRLTPDLEHDLMVYFASEQQDELSTYLIMKALYSRPGKNGN